MTVHFVYADPITSSYLRLPYLIFHMVGTVAILKVWFIALRLVWVKKKKGKLSKIGITDCHRRKECCIIIAC